MQHSEKKDCVEEMGAELAEAHNQVNPYTVGVEDFPDHLKAEMIIRPKEAAVVDLPMAPMDTAGRTQRMKDGQTS